MLGEQKLALPTWFEEFRLPGDRPGKPVVVYTDLEPDDVLALMCMRASNRRPIAIYSADLQQPYGKDVGGVLAKKLLLAATGLGLAFLRDLFILDGSDADVEATQRIRNAVSAAEAQCGVGASDWYIMAPGRGRLPALLRGQPRTLVRIYSGSFNTRKPNSTAEDLEAIASVAETLRDSSAFIFRGSHPKLDCIAACWETLDADVVQANPLFAEIWRIFAAEFDGKLVDPKHPSLFGTPLSPEEQQHFDEKIAPLAKDSMKDYCQALLKSDCFDKVAGYKKATVKALAAEKLDCGICDVLIPMGEFLYPQGYTEKATGRWSCNHEKGHTAIGSDGVCDGERLSLRDPDAAWEMFSKEVRMRVLRAIALEAM